jgi:hypothetical protein
MKVVFAGAGLFLLLALWAFIFAMQLIPTDLGNSSLIAASILLSTAALLAALGFFGQSILKTLAFSGEPAMVSPPALPVAPEAPLAPEVPAGLSASPVLAGAAAGVAIGAAISVHAAAPAEAHQHQLEELERDLFAEIKTDTRAERMTATAEVDVEIKADADSVLPEPAHDASAETGADLALALVPLPPVPSFEFPAPSAPASPLAEEPHRTTEDAAHRDDHGDNRAPPEPEPAPENRLPPEPAAMFAAEPAPDAPGSAPVSPTPGLIHDEDLARLSEADAELAPIETLEIVGAYDSGGTRFTMYSDGSVTAFGEGVDQRFRSLDDLKSFIDGGMKT